LAVDSNVKPNLVELTCKSGHGTIAAIADQMAEKTRERQIGKMMSLFFLEMQSKRAEEVEEGDSR